MVLWALAGTATFAFLLLWPRPWLSLADPETSQSRRDEVIFNLGPGESAGQIFTSRRSGLNSLTIWVTGAQGQTRLDLSIQSAGPTRPPFVQTTRSAGTGVSAFTVTFPAQYDGADHAYRLTITCPANGCAGAQVYGSSDPESDPTGWAALPNGASLSADLAYTTTYAYTGLSALEDGWTLLRLSPFILAALFVALAPGWVVLRLLSGARQAARSSLVHTIALSIGLSLSMTALLMLWSSTAGFAWQSWSLVILVAGTAAVAILLWRQAWRTDAAGPRGLWDRSVFFLFLAVLLVRFAMVRDLAGPPWVDAFHHALLTRLILDQGALPTTLEPFLSIPPTAYHLGYHSSLALFTWLSRLDLSGAMLLFGQVLNTLIVFPVYALAHEMNGSRRAALAAALAAGLLSPMPAYYTSWSRYTHLAGLLILPTFVILARQVYLPGLAPLPKVDRLRRFALAAAAFGGLALVHYRVVAFAGLLALFDCLWQNWKKSKSLGLALRQGLRSFARLAVVGAGGFLLASPWLVKALAYTILPRAGVTLAKPTTWFTGFAFASLSTGLGWAVIIAAAVGLAAALVKQPRFALTLAFWTAALFCISNLGAMGLPGSGLVNQSSVTISLFLPLSLLAGWGFDRTARLVETSLHRFSLPAGRLTGFWLLLLVVAGSLGSLRQIPLLHSDTFLLRQADLAGLAWAADHLPAGSRTAVNPFNWGYGIYAPSDGGGWLAGLGGLATVPAPVLSGMGTNLRLDEEKKLSAAIIRTGTDPESLATVLREANIDYVFTGQKGGAIAAQRLLKSQAFQVLYDGDGVRIFAVIP